MRPASPDRGPNRYAASPIAKVRVWVRNSWPEEERVTVGEQERQFITNALVYTAPVQIEARTTPKDLFRLSRDVADIGVREQQVHEHGGAAARKGVHENRRLVQHCRALAERSGERVREADIACKPSKSGAAGSCSLTFLHLSLVANAQ